MKSRLALAYWILRAFDVPAHRALHIAASFASSCRNDKRSAPHPFI